VLRDVPPQQVPQHDSPQEEEPFEILVVATERQEPQGPPIEEPQLPQNNDPQNNDHDNNHREQENNKEEEEEGNEAEGEMMKTTLLGATPRRMRHSTMLTRSKLLEMKPQIPTGRLRDLLNRINITTPPEFRIKRILHLGREEYKAIVEILSGPNVLS
jgi:hypothetical protein